jgi:hypothetical protein
MERQPQYPWLSFRLVNLGRHAWNGKLALTRFFLRSHHNWREIDGCCMRCRSLIFLRELLNLECKDGPNKIFVS